MNVPVLFFRTSQFPLLQWVEQRPHKDLSMSQPLVPVKETLLGNRVFVDVIKGKDVKMRSSRI